MFHYEIKTENVFISFYGAVCAFVQCFIPGKQVRKCQAIPGCNTEKNELYMKCACFATLGIVLKLLY